MGLLITLSLITFNVYGSIASAFAPPKRGFSYIEVWMVGVMITINFAILEYFIILALKRTQGFANLDELTAKMDFISLIISLKFFMIFNIVYWLEGLEFL